MIAFATSIVDPEAYRLYARPGIERAREPGSAVLAFAAVGTVGRSCNLLLDAAARRDDLEALVIVDQAAEIVDPGFCDGVRRALRDPEVAVAGAVGATGVRTIAWWEGEVRCGEVVHRYDEHGGGALPAIGWKPVEPPPADVETVDGFLMALSPWAVRNLRFDESLSLGHGYDLDYCLRARAAGRRVTTAGFRVVRHHPLELVEDHDLWVEAHIRFAEKWDGRIPGRGQPGPVDWKARARRAEAEREAARTMSYSNTLRVDARALPLERELEEMTSSLSWRVTAPLRRLNRMRRR